MKHFGPGQTSQSNPVVVEKFEMDSSCMSLSEIENEEQSSIETNVHNESSKSIYIKFAFFCISILCSISSYSGLIDLQSSINISDALGNRSLMLMSIATVLCCLFLAPVVTVAFGAKNTILFSQLCYIVYVVSNFYPVPYVLLPGGVFLGIAEGFLYGPALMYCTSFGRKLAGIKSCNVKKTINRFVGYFWAIFQMNEIFGNSISTIILNLGKTASTNPVHAPPVATYNSTTDLSPFSNYTTSNFSIGNISTTVSTTPHHVVNYTVHNMHDFSMCGADDCYNENQYGEKQGNYIPMSKAAVYTMLGVYTCLAVIAFPIMWMTPSLPRRSRKFTKTDKNVASTKQKRVYKLYIRQMWRHFKKTLTQLVSSQQLLITPLTLYHGLYVSFISSEISRAFVSCTVGVEMVGIGMLGGGIVNVIVSFLYGVLSGSDFCRNLLLVITIVLDASLYVFCLLWRPSMETSYLGLLVCIAFGFSDGVWSPLLDGKYAKYFSKNEEIAYSVNNLWNCVGFTLMYGWTTLLCVRQKIYIQLAVLCLGVISLCGAEIFYKRKKQSPAL